MAYGVYMTAKVSDYRKDPGIKSQGQIYMRLNSAIQLVSQNLLSSFDGRCLILPNV